MNLTMVEKERLADSKMKLQSVANTLKHVDPKKVEGLDQIEDCLEAAESSLKAALGK